MLIAAFPSVVIALQPNTERVRGRFILYVLSRSIPSAITLVLSVMAVYAGSFYLPEDLGALSLANGEMNPLLTLTVTCAGLVMLFRIMQPFNVLRAATYAVSVAVTAVVFCVPVLGEIVYKGWSEVSFNLTQILFLICIILAAFPVSSALLKMCDLMNPTD